jgi:hypothetical protein
MHTRPVGLDLSVQLQDRMPGFDLKIFLQFLVGLEGIKMLHASGNFDLVCGAQQIEQGSVFELVHGKTGQVDIGQHGDVKENRPVVYQAQALKIDAAGIAFALADGIAESLFPGTDFGLDNKPGAQIAAQSRRGAFERQNAHSFSLAFYNAAPSLLLYYKTVVDQTIQGVAHRRSGGAAFRTKTCKVVNRFLQTWRKYTLFLETSNK